MKCFEIDLIFCYYHYLLKLTVNMKCFEMLVQKRLGHADPALTVNMKCFEINDTIITKKYII